MGPKPSNDDQSSVHIKDWIRDRSLLYCIFWNIESIMYQSDDQLGWLEALPAKVGGEGSIPSLCFAAHFCTTRPLIRRAKAGPTLAFEWAEVAAFVWAGGGRADDGRCLPRPGDGIPPKIRSRRPKLLARVSGPSRRKGQGTSLTCCCVNEGICLPTVKRVFF